MIKGIIVDSECFSTLAPWSILQDRAFPGPLALFGLSGDSWFQRCPDQNRPPDPEANSAARNSLLHHQLYEIAFRTRAFRFCQRVYSSILCSPGVGGERIPPEGDRFACLGPRTSGRALRSQLRRLSQANLCFKMYRNSFANGNNAYPIGSSGPYFFDQHK